jgi:hypothetical protein
MVVAGFGTATLAAIVVDSAVIAASWRALALFADVRRLTLRGVVLRTSDTLIGRRITNLMRRITSHTVSARLASNEGYASLRRAFSAFRNAITKARADLSLGTARAGIRSAGNASAGVSPSFYLAEVVATVATLAVIIRRAVVLDADSVIRPSALAALATSGGPTSSSSACPRIIATTHEWQTKTEEGTQENARIDDA